MTCPPYDSDGRGRDLEDDADEEKIDCKALCWPVPSKRNGDKEKLDPHSMEEWGIVDEVYEGETKMMRTAMTLW